MEESDERQRKTRILVRKRISTVPFFLSRFHSPKTHDPQDGRAQVPKPPSLFMAPSLSLSTRHQLCNVASERKFHLLHTPPPPPPLPFPASCPFSASLPPRHRHRRHRCFLPDCIFAEGGGSMLPLFSYTLFFLLPCSTTNPTSSSCLPSFLPSFLPSPPRLLGYPAPGFFFLPSLTPLLTLSSPSGVSPTAKKRRAAIVLLGAKEAEWQWHVLMEQGETRDSGGL